MQKQIFAAVFAVVFVLTASNGGAISPRTDGAANQSEAELRRLPEVWPMPIKQFLAGNYLERADVVLTRRDYDLTSFLIRWATGSPFSHSALVFNQPDENSGITNTFLIEAGTGGVDLTNIKDYLADKSSFIALKRFRKPWFDDLKQARVRGILLDKIKAEYNYWAIGRVARNIWFGVQNNLRSRDQRASGRAKVIKQYRDNDWQPPSEYICSGLVQVGFVETAIEYISRGLLPPEALNEVVFVPEAEKWLPNAKGWQRLGQFASRSAKMFREQNAAALEAVTPHDLAVSDKLEWLYLIRDGKVHKVSSLKQVMTLIEGQGGGANARDALAPDRTDRNG
jgi:hypothetical protein